MFYSLLHEDPVRFHPTDGVGDEFIFPYIHLQALKISCGLLSSVWDRVERLIHNLVFQSNYLWLLLHCYLEETH